MGTQLLSWRVFPFVMAEKMFYNRVTPFPTDGLLNENAQEKGNNVRGKTLFGG